MLAAVKLTCFDGGDRRWRDVTIMHDVLFAGWLIYVIVTSRGHKLLHRHLMFVLLLSDEKYTYVEQQTRIIRR